MPIFDAPVNLTQNELQNAVVQNLASNPSSPKLGQIYYNTSSGLQVCTNATGPVWASIATVSAAGLLSVPQLAVTTSGATITGTTVITGALSTAGGSGTITSAQQLTVTSGGLTVSAGGATITGTTQVTGAFSTSGASGTITSAQQLTVTTGGLTVSAGGASITGTITSQAITASGTITANGGLTVGASQAVSMGSNVVTNVATPVNPTDATNKSYVDGAVQGLEVKTACHFGDTGSETYTIVSGAVTSISGTSLDGGSPAVGDRIFIGRAPASTGAGAGSTLTIQPANGIYVVSSNTINLTVARATDMSLATEVIGTYTFIETGTVNGGNGYLVTSPAQGTAVTINTTPIQWAQFSGAGSIIAGTGLSKSGNTISIENSGVLLSTHGGSGVASPTAHGVLIAEGSSPFATVSPSATTGLALVSAGSSADPAFGALNLTATGSVTNALPIVNGGTASTSAAGARTSLAVPALYTTTITGNSSTTSFTVTPSVSPSLTGAWNVVMINQTTGNQEYPNIAINQSTNVITVSFGNAPTTGLIYSILVTG